MAIDRNQLARQQQAIRSMRLQLIRAIETGAATGMDRFANKIVIGSQILWDMPGSVVWQVTGVDVGPEEYWQPGTMQLTVQATVPMIVRPNAPNQQLTVVGFTHPDGVQTELTSPSAMPEGMPQAAANRTTPSGLVLPFDPKAPLDDGGETNGGGDGGPGTTQ